MSRLPPTLSAALIAAGLALFVGIAPAGAQDAVSLTVASDGDLVPSLRVAFMLMALSLVPAFLMSVTSFTRIVIVLGFVRQALGTHSAPPNQVIVGLSLFLCLFTMGPVFSQIHDVAIAPYQAGELSDMEALDAGMGPVRTFMARHTRPEDLGLFVSMIQEDKPENLADVSTTVMIPAFMLSELRTAFIMGSLILIPFLIIDMVVASVLMAMGMMMVPPVMVSLPIKLLLFVLADGWNLVIGSLARSVMGGGL
ncbi:MAG: flagellar biosynthetic protein FliP [Flavobacteriales bacterium]|jgi:flagellar biosynthetic protein FliP